MSITFRLSLDTTPAGSGQAEQAAFVADLLRQAARAVERGARVGTLRDLEGQEVGAFAYGAGGPDHA